MRVLHVGAWSAERCGEKEWGQLLSKELAKIGVQLVEWDGTYPKVYERGHVYLPSAEQLSDYDLIHLNWSPSQTGHYLPQHFPDSIPLSIFMHDVPPHSTCPLWDRADLRMAYEKAEGGWVEVIDHAVPSYIPAAPPALDRVVVGVTGVRDDPGMGMVAAVCEKKGWELSLPHWMKGGDWLPLEQEIERLAASTFNVCWYKTSGRGKSMAAMLCAASRRPLILSGSSMFSNLWPYSDEVYLAVATHDPLLGKDGEGSLYEIMLEPLLEIVELKIRQEAQGLPGNDIPVRYPGKLLEELSWQRCALRIKGLWEKLLKEKRQ